MLEEAYKALICDIREELDGTDSNKKTDVTNDEKIESAAVNQSREQDAEYDNRNILYTRLLETYIENYKSKEKTKGIYKCIFFVITILLFLAIVICGLIGIVVLSVLGDGSWANVGIAIANVAGIVSSLIVLPKIIAEHLFPTNEESNMLEMVRNMQDNDAQIRQILFDMKEDRGDK